MVCVDERFSKPYKTYFGEDVIDKFLNDLIREREYCFKVIETEFNKLLVITKKDSRDSKLSTKCCISKKREGGCEVKVKDHDHTIGKYRESAHQEFHLNLSLSKMLCFIICKSMIHILSFKKLENIISK